jgi:hypothetical protein
VEQLVMSLPPKERACVLLKDVFDYTLEEIAELVSSTMGGVKAALNRGRSKLAASPEPVPSHREMSPELSRLCISTSSCSHRCGFKEIGGIIYECTFAINRNGNGLRREPAHEMAKLFCKQLAWAT